MYVSGFARRALTVGVVAALLSGCGASGQATVPQRGGEPRACSARSIVDVAEAQSVRPLLQRWGRVAGRISIALAKLVGTLKGFDYAQGVCSDSAGHVFERLLIPRPSLNTHTPGRNRSPRSPITAITRSPTMQRFGANRRRSNVADDVHRQQRRQLRRLRRAARSSTTKAGGRWRGSPPTTFSRAPPHPRNAGSSTIFCWIAEFALSTILSSQWTGKFGERVLLRISPPG